MIKIFKYISLLIVSAILSACLNGSNAQNHHVGTETELQQPPRVSYSRDPIASLVLSNNKLSILDDSLPVAYMDAYEILYEDIEALTHAAEVIFVGRVVDYKERLYTAPPSPGTGFCKAELGNN